MAAGLVADRASNALHGFRMSHDSTSMFGFGLGFASSMPRTSTCQAAALDKPAPSVTLMILFPCCHRRRGLQAAKCSSCNIRHYAAVKNGRQRDSWTQCGRLIGLAANIRPPQHMSRLSLLEGRQKQLARGPLPRCLPQPW